MRSHRTTRHGRAFDHDGDQTSTALVARRRRAAADAGGTLVASAPAASAAPSCAEGPQRIGEAILGTPCDDMIRVPAGVSSVQGGAGNDTIVAAPIAAGAPCTGECLHLGVRSQTFDGGPGDDVIFGERGNDSPERRRRERPSLRRHRRRPPARWVRETTCSPAALAPTRSTARRGNDLVRGDATSTPSPTAAGGVDVDTLSYATGVTPGFSDHPDPPTVPAVREYVGFPKHGEGRGVYIDLDDPKARRRQRRRPRWLAAATAESTSGPRRR